MRGVDRMTYLKPVPPTGPGNHRSDSNQAGHALTLKLDHSMGADHCLIFVPFGHYDEPGILPYENPSICPRGADVRQSGNTLSRLISFRPHKSSFDRRIFVEIHYLASIHPDLPKTLLLIGSENTLKGRLFFRN